MLTQFLFVVEVIEAVVLATILSVFAVWFLTTQTLHLYRHRSESIDSLVPALVGMTCVLILISVAFYAVLKIGC